MSHLLWKCFHDGDVERFKHILMNGVPSTNSTTVTTKSHTLATGNAQSYGSLGGSPSGFATSPRNAIKHRKVSGHGTGNRNANNALGRAEVNSRDHAGMTILHRAASSQSATATEFAMILLEHPAIDLYVQDAESGWTALHRALYFGHIALARAIIEKDHRSPTSQQGNSGQKVPTSIIKVKDHEGNSPFDVYNATIARRSLLTGLGGEAENGSDVGSDDDDSTPAIIAAEQAHASINGDEVFAWGSSRNHGLGFKDQDDRQHPEKISLQRPDHLLFRFYREHPNSIEDESRPLHQSTSFPKIVSELPTLISNRPIIIQDIVLSKLHSAILTTDPESNLYMCGFGPGGRLGTGDESTRFSYVPIDSGALAGKKITKVALGQNHTLAVTSEGFLFSWGSNLYGQLGYALPRPALKDEEPTSATPRQIFNLIKRESIVGVASSTIHSVAYTSTSLFTWGKNEGQLGLMDSDSRSLEIQPVPRKVAASLFKSSISMVSAINSATIILLANHTVCVFTNYGYNIVKFPLTDSFTNYHLKSSVFTTQYDSPCHISYVTAGGDTIAAISSRGDLFALTVRGIPTGATSTTNPAKIKDSLTSPQRIWALRKGNWDGVKSVGVTENGSVIVCTQAGAVWKRVKRTHVKDVFTKNGNHNGKDFKFQRIPGLTNVAAVRSTTYGVYAAVRKDCDVTRTQITVQGQNLWQDLGRLFPLRGLEASMPAEDSDQPKFWTPAMTVEHFEPFKRAVLISPDLEADVSRLLGRISSNGHDIVMTTSTSNVCIPVHGFIIGRSATLRQLLDKARTTGSAAIPDVVTIESIPESKMAGSARSNDKRPIVKFEGLDFIALVNLVSYLYTDTVLDVWHFTRHSPTMAFRFRQVRVELMKTAAHLKLFKLESAVRLMTDPEKCVNLDLDLAIEDESYFSDGDTIIELEDTELTVHSALLCQRCPFFDGLFNGRASGQWLVDRRENESDHVRIDLKHVQADVFAIILRYIYSDPGTDIFDGVVCGDMDELCDLILDVMAVSNELMLDRLSQICQEVIGRFVNSRNVCYLLNAIAPCSVTTFKDSALEYICLQLECMLENHLLNDLDEDLLHELDDIVQANQLNCLPFAKSGRADLVLHDRYPYLAEEIHEERRRRIGDMIFRATHKDDEGRLSSSNRMRVGSLDDMVTASPSHGKTRRKSRNVHNTSFSPNIEPKDSNGDLIFDMDDDDESVAISSPVSPPPTARGPLSPERGELAGSRPPWDGIEASSISKEETLSLYSTTPLNESQKGGQSPVLTPKKWSSPALSSTKLDMREIMAQASKGRPSALSMSLSAQRAKAEKTGTSTPPKLSQKERKKQSQQQALAQPTAKPQITTEVNAQGGSPWQTTSRGPITSLKDVLQEPSPSVSPGASKSMIVPIPSDPPTPRRTASPDTRFSGQSRSGKKGQPSAARPLLQAAAAPSSSPFVPHSKSYITRTAVAEPSLQLPLSDIIGQQRREQEVIKEAVAKRSLQEIQEEQAFQEWWDQESRRTQEEEAARSKAPPSSSGRGGKSNSSRGKSGGRGRGRGRGDGAQVRGRGRAQDNGSPK